MTRVTTSSASELRRNRRVIEIPRRADTGVHAGHEEITYADLRTRVSRRHAAAKRVPPGVPAILRVGMSIGDVVGILGVLGQPALLLSSAWTETEVAQSVRQSVPMARRDNSDSPTSELNAIALCQPTSGSTSKPRLAARSHQALRSEIDVLTAALNLGASDRVLCCSAISHSYGLMILLANIAAGADIWLGSDVDTINRARPTLIFGLGPLYGRMLEQNLDLSTVRMAFSAGAPLPDGLYDRFRDRYGIPIRQDYGTTETGTISLDLSEVGSPDDVGSPLPHMQVRVSAGRVEVRGDAIASGYVTPDGLEPCRDGEGWYQTADTGSLNGGRLRLGARVREPIVIGGATVNPDDLERRIAVIPEIRDVAVVPAPGPRLRVVVAGGATQVDAWCRENLPASVYGATTVETRPNLPRSPAGKLLRHELLS